MAVVFGLSAPPCPQITFRNGRVDQPNVPDYPGVRLPEAPVVETHNINRGPKLGGVGEPGTPPIAPAVGSAMFAATGRRLRSQRLRLL